MDDVCAPQNLSDVSLGSGVGNGEDGRVMIAPGQILKYGEQGFTGRLLVLPQLREHGFHLALGVQVAGAASGCDAVAEHGLRFGDAVGAG